MCSCNEIGNLHSVDHDVTRNPQTITNPNQTSENTTSKEGTNLSKKLDTSYLMEEVASLRKKLDASYLRIVHYPANNNDLKLLNAIWDIIINNEYINTTAMIKPQNKDRRTAWPAAAQCDPSDIIITLLKSLKETLDRCYFRIFLYSARHNDLELLNSIWNTIAENEHINKTAIIKLQNKDRRTAWPAAAQCDPSDITITLLANLRKTLDACYLMLLHYSASNNDLKLLNTIWDIIAENEHINKTAIIKLQNKDKRTAWHTAAQCGSLDFVKALLASLKKTATSTRVDVNQHLYDSLMIKDKLGWTAWHIAAQCGHLDIIKSFLSSTEIDMPKHELYDIIYWANFFGQQEVVEWLEQHKVDNKSQVINMEQLKLR